MRRQYGFGVLILLVISIAVYMYLPDYLEGQWNAWLASREVRISEIKDLIEEFNDVQKINRLYLLDGRTVKVQGIIKSYKSRGITVSEMFSLEGKNGDRIYVDSKSIRLEASLNKRVEVIGSYKAKCPIAPPTNCYPYMIIEKVLEV